MRVELSSEFRPAIGPGMVDSLVLLGESNLEPGGSDPAEVGQHKVNLISISQEIVGVGTEI